MFRIRIVPIIIGCAGLVACSESPVAPAQALGPMATVVAECDAGLDAVRAAVDGVTFLSRQAAKDEAALLAKLDAAQAKLDQGKLEDAALQGKKAAAFAFVPTLSVNAQERLTNATGFLGRSSVYALQAVLLWKLDYSTYASAQAQAQAQEAAPVPASMPARAERTEPGFERGEVVQVKRYGRGEVRTASAVEVSVAFADGSVRSFQPEFVAKARGQRARQPQAA